MEITEEMRRVVHLEDCEELGHQLDYSAARTKRPGGPGVDVEATDSLHLPHITCTRCGLVWIVLPQPGWGYDDAERAVYGLLRAEAPIARSIARNRGRRGVDPPVGQLGPPELGPAEEG